MTTTEHRIPHQVWINSQMSIARHYGGITLNGKKYLIEKETGDLVHKAKHPRNRILKNKP